MKFKTKEEREKFILDHEYILKTIIKREVFPEWKSSDDVYQTGWEALIKSVDRYEPKGVSFLTYAYCNIRQEVFRYILDYRNKNYLYLKSSDKDVSDVRVLSLEEEKFSDCIHNRTWDNDKEVNIEEEVESKLLREEFLKRLFSSTMSTQTRKVLKMYFIYQLPQIEISRKLNITRQLVENKITYHFDRVFNQMKKEWALV